MEANEFGNKAVRLRSMFSCADLQQHLPLCNCLSFCYMAEVRKRRASETFKTASLATFEGYTKEGWKVAKKSAKSVRLGMPKRPDEQLEDELFCLCADLGFPDLGRGRQFKITSLDLVVSR